MAGGGQGMGLQRNQSMYPGGAPTHGGMGSPFGRAQRPGMGMPGRGMPFGGMNRGFPGQANGQAQGNPYQDSMRAFMQNMGGLGRAGTYFNEPPPPTNGAPPAISDPHRDYGAPQPPRMMDGNGMQAQGLGGVRDAQGNVYADRSASPRAYDAGTFNPAAGQWAQYGDPRAAGSQPFSMQNVNGMNMMNGQLWGPEGLAQGGPAASNFAAHYAPMWNAQRMGR